MPTIDLHGIKHEHVSRLLDEFIWDNMTIKTTCITIITGKSEAMKQVVCEAVEEYGFEVEESSINAGVVTVNLF